MKSTISRIRIATLVALIFVASCGDDDTSSTDTQPAQTESEATDGTDPPGAEDDLAAYCDASLAVETAGEPDVDFETATPEEVAAAFQAFATETVRPLVDEVVAVAPDEISDDVSVLSTAVDEVADSGNVAAFEDPEVAAAEQRVHAFDLEGCGWTTIPVTARDYAFDDLPETLDAGPVSLELDNQGAEYHELVLMRKNDGVTDSAEDLLALPEEEAMEKTTFIGVAEPVAGGEGSYLVADLEPGDYVALCFLPTGTTTFEEGPSGDGPPHFTHGMVAEVSVT